jgi:hypothetical protein
MKYGTAGNKAGEETLHTSFELIDTADPFQPTFGEIVERDKVVIARNAMDRTNAYLIQPSKEIFRDINWLPEALDTYVGHDMRNEVL